MIRMIQQRCARLFKTSGIDRVKFFCFDEGSCVSTIWLRYRAVRVGGFSSIAVAAQWNLVQFGVVKWFYSWRTAVTLNRSGHVTE